MRKLSSWALAALAYCLSPDAQAQEHYAGMVTSNRVGLLNANINPAELSNLSGKFEFNVYGFSANLLNNKIGLKDVSSDTSLDKLLFQGNEPVNFRVDSEILWPGIAFRVNQWGFGIGGRTFMKFNLIDADANIGNAIKESDVNNILNGIPTTVQTNTNQRLNATVWSEVNLSASRVVWNEGNHRFTAGGTLKLLFPASYANFGADQFKGTFERVTNVPGVANDVYLYNAHAFINFSYSGNLANNFRDNGSYTNTLFGGLQGIGADVGVNYRYKHQGSRKYKVNAGFSVRNLGAMTFKDDNNKNVTYELSIPNKTGNNYGLGMKAFDQASSLEDVEQKLIQSGYLTKKVDEQKNFRVNLPTVINLYADVQLLSWFALSGYMQQKTRSDNDNEQITAQNCYTLTPRIQGRYVELFAPLTQSEFSGFNAGLGLRLGGFYVGSNSAFSLLGNSKQADVYFGLRWGFGK